MKAVFVTVVLKTRRSINLISNVHDEFFGALLRFEWLKSRNFALFG